MSETYDLTIRRRANYALTVTLTDEQNNVRPIENYVAAMQIRPTLESRRVLATKLSANGGIVIDEPNGQLTAYFTHQETRDMDFDSAVYDMLIKSPTDGQEWVIGGAVTVLETVTRVTL